MTLRQLLRTKKAPSNYVCESINQSFSTDLVVQSQSQTQSPQYICTELFGTSVTVRRTVQHSQTIFTPAKKKINIMSLFMCDQTKSDKKEDHFDITSLKFVCSWSIKRTCKPMCWWYWQAPNGSRILGLNFVLLHHLSVNPTYSRSQNPLNLLHIEPPAITMDLWCISYNDKYNNWCKASKLIAPPLTINRRRILWKV